MMKIKFLLLVLSLGFLHAKGIAQAWMPLGSNEQTGQAIVKTSVLVTYTAADVNGTQYVSYLDDLGDSNHNPDLKIHVRKYVNSQWVDLGAVSTAIPATDFFPIACDGTDVYLAYSESLTSSTGLGKVSVKKFNAANNTWDWVGQPAFSAGAAGATGIVAANGKIYVAYSDESKMLKIVVKSFDSANPGAGWQTMGAEGFSIGQVATNTGSNISLAVDNDQLYVAYLDLGVNGNDGGVIVKKFTGSTWIAVGINIASGPDPGFSYKLRFDTAHNPYVAYSNPNTAELTVRKLFINQWVRLSNNAPATNTSGSSAFAVVNDELYVAYISASTQPAQVYVKKYDATVAQWQNVGSQPVTASPVEINDVNLVAAGSQLYLNFRGFNSDVFAKSFNLGGTLPVTIKSFTGKAQNNNALLQWTTANEVNNKLFEVEHSTNGEAFTKAGEVKAAGGSAEHGYKYTVAGLEKGTHFFRLKQVDNDGAFTYSATVAVNITNQQLPAITVYPNPVKEALNISGDINDYTELSITNIEGKVVRRMKVNSNLQRILVSDLPAGRYFLTLRSASAKHTVSFVK